MPQASPNTKPFLTPDIETVYLIGVGGTGGYLAQGLAKLCAGYQLPLNVVLVDPDTIEEKNIFRQNFHAYEIGQAKAEALALRLNQQYGLSWGHHVGDGVEFATNPQYGRSYSRNLRKTLMITCVDKPEVRRDLGKAIGNNTLWLDTGNELDFGQTVIGTCSDKKALNKAIKEWSSSPVTNVLPSPYIKCGWDKARTKKKKSAPSCADLGYFEEQSVFINEWIAQAALNILFQVLIRGRIDTPAIFVDTERGRMLPARIDKDYLTC